MPAHEPVVLTGDEPFHAFHPKDEEMCPMGTYVQLGAGDPVWWADGLEKAILYCFRSPRQIKVTALRFNGETIFDDRYPNKRLKPIATKVRKPNIPEWETKEK